MRFSRIFQVANQKARKGIDYVLVILNKIHLSLFTESFLSFTPGISPFRDLVVVKKQIDVSFFMRLSSYS